MADMSNRPLDTRDEEEKDSGTIIIEEPVTKSEIHLHVKNLSGRSIYILQRMEAVVMLIIAAACLILTEHILGILPYILVVTLLAMGALGVYRVFRDLKFSKQETRVLSNSMVYIAMAFVILFNGESSMFVIAAAWGMLGLVTETKSLSLAIYDVSHKEGTVIHRLWHLFFSAFGIAISFMLLLDPEAHLHTHILLLGLELILAAGRIWQEARWEEKTFGQK